MNVSFFFFSLTNELAFEISEQGVFLHVVGETLEDRERVRCEEKVSALLMSLLVPSVSEYRGSEATEENPHVNIYIYMCVACIWYPHHHRSSILILSF